MTELNADVFFEVKKEILDKLDVVLQKINLQLINYINPKQDEFSFIQLSCFEGEITKLFNYLDRLYASLNSSVSFSSVQSYKESAEHYQYQNQKLLTENNELRKKIVELSSNQVSKDSTPRLQSSSDLVQHLELMMANGFSPLRGQLLELKCQFLSMVKYMKKQMKQFKFQMLQNRIQIISKLRQQNREQNNQGQEQQSQPTDNHCNQERHYQQHAQILQHINHILAIC